jgi:hypothetical protein
MIPKKIYMLVGRSREEDKKDSILEDEMERTSLKDARRLLKQKTNPKSLICYCDWVKPKIATFKLERVGK